MEDTEVISQIIVNQKAKYRNLNQVYDLTKEIEDTLESGDGEALEMVLDMRQKQLELCTSADEKNEKLISTCQEEKAAHLRKLVRARDGSSEEPDSPQEKEIYDMAKRIHALLMKTIDYDRRVNSRIMK